MKDNSSATVMLGLEGLAVLAVAERDGEVQYAIDPRCEQQTWTETHPGIAPRASWTERAGAQACRRVGRDGHAVAAVAREFGVGWATVMAAVRDHGERLLQRACPGAGATAIGVDETAFTRANAVRGTAFATGIVDLHRGRLIDVGIWSEPKGAQAATSMTRPIGDHTQPHELLLDRAGLPTQFSTWAVNSTESARTSACRCSKGRLTDHGFRNFSNYRLRLLLHCGISWNHQIPTPLRGRLPRLAA